jgi:uncharacterized integral membrane protein
MKALGRVWWMSLGAVLSFVVILFAIHNDTTVAVNLVEKRYLVEVWALVMMAVAAGLAVPALFVIGQRIAGARREGALKREIQELKRELHAHRNAALVEPIPGEAPAAGRGGAERAPLLGPAAGAPAATALAEKAAPPLHADDQDPDRAGA